MIYLLSNVYCDNPDKAKNEIRFLDYLSRG